VDYERARYIHAIRAMSDFLRANNAPLHFAQQFNRLAVAISDLNEGRTDALLAPTPTGGVDQERETLPVASDKKGPLPVARRGRR